MDYRDRYERRMQRKMRRRNCNQNSGPIVGLVFLLIGGLLISRAVGVPIPDFIISWQMLLITIGAIIGVASRFRNPGFIFPIIIGSFFLLQEYYPDMIPREFILPSIFIFFGVFLIFKPRRRWRQEEQQDGPDDGTSETKQDNPGSSGYTATEEETIPGSSTYQNPGNTGYYKTQTSSTDEADQLEETAVFGNIRKSLITKNFTGGEVSTVFGSAEINLLQADMQQNSKLEVNAVFGSVRLIVPTHWQIKLKTAAVLGAVEDKRPKHAIYSDRLLVLEGNAVFGGIQIESH